MQHMEFDPYEKLGSLSGRGPTDGPGNRQLINNPNMSDIEVAACLKDMESHDDEVVLNALTRLRMGLCQENNPPTNSLINFGGVRKLMHFMNQDDDSKWKFKFEAAWCLTNIASGTPEQTLPIVECGGIEAFLKACVHSEHKIREQALWAVGNIAGDNSVYRDRLVEGGLIQIMERYTQSKNTSSLTYHETHTYFKNAAWVCTNILRFKPLPNVGLCKMAALIINRIMDQYEESDVVTDCCWALVFLTEGTTQQNPQGQQESAERINCLL